MKFLFRQWIQRTEQRFGVELSHLSEILDISFPAFIKLLLMFPIASHRQHAPVDSWHLARVAATRAEGCGACVQMAIYSAHRAGVSQDLLRKTLNGDRAKLPPCLSDVIEFATDVAQGYPSPELHSRLLQWYGAPAVMELGLAIAASRFFPAYKRALGYGAACPPSANPTNDCRVHAS